MLGVLRDFRRGRSVLERYGPTESAVGRESLAHEDYLNWLHRSEAPLGLDAKYKPNTKGYLQRLRARDGFQQAGRKQGGS